MTKKSAFLSILLIVLTVSLMGGSTYAFFTNSVDASARLDTGTVKIKVEKWQNPCGTDDSDQQDASDRGDSDEQAAPNCDGPDYQYYRAVWKITNQGSDPVYLHSTVAPSWETKTLLSTDDSAAGVTSQSSSPVQMILGKPKPKQPTFVPGGVNGWYYSGGEYLYTGRNSLQKPKILGSNQYAIFSLPFGVDGPSGRTYKLDICLTVTANQVSGSAAAIQEADQSADAEEAGNP